MLDLCCLLADDDRNDIRIEAALVKLYSQRDGLADRGRTDPDPGWPRLRDGRRRWVLGASARCRRSSFCATCGSTGSSRDLGDHAPADRPRGGRRSTCRSPATSSTRRPSAGPKGPGGCAGRRLLRAVAADARRRVGSGARGLRRVRSAGGHVRHIERASRKLARSTFYAMARWQGKLERKQSFLGRVVDIGAELFAMSASACARHRSGRTGRRASSWPTCSASRPGYGCDGAVHRALVQHRRPDVAGREGCSRGVTRR